MKLHSHAIEESPFSLFQRLRCTYVINHRRHRWIVSYIITKVFLVWPLVKIAYDVCFLDRKWTPVMVTAFTINSFSTDLASLVGYQFFMFAYCVKSRYEVLLAFAKQQFSKNAKKPRRNIQLVENLSHLHLQLATALRIINETLSLQVNIVQSKRGKIILFSASEEA